MNTFNRPAGPINREAALGAYPCRLPVVRTRQEDQKLQLTVRFERPRWQRWLGGSPSVERTFRLDRFGQEVYQACDGNTKVKSIVRQFAGQHKISLVEAELSVTAFLKTLVSKGLVAMAVERENL